jgi:hypothetical protein
MFGICNLAIVPVRLEANHRSEMVTQLLFGEHFEIIEKTKGWLKIKIQFDNYEGWIDEKQFQPISDTDFELLSSKGIILNADLIEYITGKDNLLFPIPLGASLSFLDIPQINTSEFSFEGLKASGKNPKTEILKTAFMYLNTPYLWGGKTPFGIDCSGFVQMVYKLNGYKLFRDAYQQATQGEVLSFIEEAEAGDLAFFDNEEGKITHVGILMNDNYIIHAHGNVRIDRLDHLGIMNVDTKRHTHKLRVIKKII